MAQFVGSHVKRVMKEVVQMREVVRKMELGVERCSLAKN